MDIRADPDRHSFLHTPECVVFWKDYITCYNKHTFLRYWVDFCGDKYILAVKCFRKERSETAKLSIEESQKNSKKLVNKTLDSILSDKFD